MPGRFATRANSVLGPATPEVLDYQLVAVVAGSSHEAYLKTFFPKARIAPFESAALARLALKDGRVNALFGDAVSLSFWLNGAEAEGCCAFSNNAYVDAKFFGDGLGIAVKKGATPLRRALDYALARLAQRGVYAELFLKYFPISPF
jgi:polar amino acid transport system substrate-binding protein